MATAGCYRSGATAPDLGELRAPVHGVAGTVLDGVGRGYSTGGGSGFRVCSDICAAELGVLRFRVGVLAQAEVEEISARIRRVTLTRSFLTLGMFVIAMLLSPKFPLWGFGLVCCVLLVYLRPEVLGFTQ